MRCHSLIGAFLFVTTACAGARGPAPSTPILEADFQRVASYRVCTSNPRWAEHYREVGGETSLVMFTLVEPDPDDHAARTLRYQTVPATRAEIHSCEADPEIVVNAEVPAS